ncbi:proline-rich protein 14 isoform X3 [Emydura macquarii macquarii]|uniref:proline-rich protein 14 isoform X3 n=1 Tax=Emydura macquarii macquarii TaxID=1129001 RepID=UPI00352A2B91
MEHTIAREVLAGGCTRSSALERHIRRQRLIIYRPSPEEQSSTIPRGPEDKAPPLCWPPGGRARPPQARRQSERLRDKQRRLQQGVPQWGQGAELWLVASPMERARHRVLTIALEECPATTQGAQVSQRDTPTSAHPATSSLPGHPIPGEVSPPSGSPQSGSDSNPTRQRPTMDRPSPEEQSSPVCQRPENKAPPLCWPPLGTAGSESERLQDKQWLLQQNQGLWASPSMSHHGKELMSSPMERAQQRVLTVALEKCPMVPDADLQQEDLLTPSPPSRVDQLTACSSSSSDQQECCLQPDLAPDAAEPPGSSSSSAWPPPICSLLRPHASVPRFRHWGIAPLFQTVKSKLETFADIFLSPVKPRLCPPPPPRPEEGESGGQPEEPPCSKEEPVQSLAGPSHQGMCCPRQGVNIEVKIAISEPAKRRGPGEAEDDGEGASVVSRRPPIHQWRLSPEDPGQPRLGRSYSCPDFPWAMPSPLPAPAPCLLRRRRHTVCSLEVSRELLRGRPSPPALPCLRKEIFPHAASRRLLSPMVRMVRCNEACSSHRGPPRHEESASALLRPRDGSQRPEQRDGGRGVATDAKRSQEGTTGKVSRFRIRKTPAKQQANLTPMGLPRPVRLDKKEFSLEEIYTNKNYRTPTEKRTFETIFEEPRERNGTLVLTSQRKLKRTMAFQDSSLPRKQRRARPRGQLAGRAPGRRRAPPQDLNLEELLHQRLAELDTLFEADGD